AIPDVAPAFWRYYSDNMTWPGTYLMVADMLYQQTGDRRVLEDHYPAMKRWMYYMQAQYMNEEGIITKDSYGDWCAPPVTIEAGRGKSADKKYPSPLISSAYYYYLLNVMANFSDVVNNGKDRAAFEKAAEQLKKDFNKRFYHADGYYGDNTMTENILAMYFGLVEEVNKEKLADRIVTIIEIENNGHLSTGVVGTQWVMRTLTEMGRTDLAYKWATNTSYPSWGYMLENGATTIWELWNGNTAHLRMNTQHQLMMLGDLLVWFYENLADIKSKESGFQTIVMKPEMIKGLNVVDASYRSLYGDIKSSWTKSESTFTWLVSVPANAKAEIYLPAKNVSSITEGNRKIEGNSDIEVLSEEGGRVRVAIGSGSYQFKTKL